MRDAIENIIYAVRGLRPVYKIIIGAAAACLIAIIIIALAPNGDVGKRGAEPSSSPAAYEGAVTEGEHNDTAQYESTDDAQLSDANNSGEGIRYTDDGYAVAEGSEITVRNTDGEPAASITVPVGYGIAADEKAFYIRQLSVSGTADGNDPIVFRWASFDRLSELYGSGVIDTSSEDGSDSASVIIIDDYESAGIGGGKFRVIVADAKRSYTSEDAPDDTRSYYIIADIYGDGADGGLCLIGTVDADTYAAYGSRRFENISDLARAIVEPADSAQEISVAEQAE